MLVKRIGVTIPKYKTDNNQTSFNGKRVHKTTFSDWFFEEVKTLVHIDDDKFHKIVKDKFFELRDAYGDADFHASVSKATARETDYFQLRHYLKIGLDVKDEKTSIDFPIGKYSSLDDYETQNRKDFTYKEQRTPIDDLYGKPGEYNPLING